MQYSKLAIGDVHVCILYCSFEVENMQNLSVILAGKKMGVPSGVYIQTSDMCSFNLIVVF